MCSFFQRHVLFDDCFSNRIHTLAARKVRFSIPVERHTKMLLQSEVGGYFPSGLCSSIKNRTFHAGATRKSWHEWMDAYNYTHLVPSDGLTFPGCPVHARRALCRIKYAFCATRVQIVQKGRQTPRTEQVAEIELGAYNPTLLLCHKNSYTPREWRKQRRGHLSGPWLIQ